VPFADPHVTIVGARADGCDGVRWPFCFRDGKRSTKHVRTSAMWRW